MFTNIGDPVLLERFAQALKTPEIHSFVSSPQFTELVREQLEREQVGRYEVHHGTHGISDRWVLLDSVTGDTWVMLGSAWVPLDVAPDEAPLTAEEL